MNKSHLFFLSLTAALLLAAGCDTPSRDRAKFQAEQEEQRKSIPPMEAQDKFFDGQIVATLSLMSGLPPLIQHVESKDGKKSNDPSFGRHNGGNASAPNDPSISPLMGAGAGGNYGNNTGYIKDEQTVGSWNGMTDNTPPPEPTREEYEAMLALKAESPLPPILLRLFLKNTTEKTITVEFIDFNSQLGNFALQPDKLKIEAGKIAHPNNVISRLGLTSYDIPVTVTLRVDGKKETKIMKLHLIQAQAEAAK